MGEITKDLIAAMHENYVDDCSAKTLTAAMAKTDIADLAFLPMNAARLNGEFTVEIKTHGITAQEQSGRCWMFASMNFLREKIITNCNMDEDFELSGNYLAFWDKLEKANNFLEQVIAYAEEDLNSRRMENLMTRVLGDGGWWSEFTDLVEKYGIVPKYAMPETYASGHTAKFLVMIRKLLRKDAVVLRRMIADGEDPADKKEEMMVEVYKFFCEVFGQPPVSFDFTWRDKDKEFHADYSITPQEFRDKYLKCNLQDYVFLCCEPSTLHPYYAPFTLHSLCNMADKNITFLNLPIEEMKELMIAQLKGGEPVWFGCDSRQYGEREKGYWDMLSFDYEGLLGGVNLSLSREDQLAYRESDACHDMCMIGVNFGADGKPDRWKIENSWGTKWGKDGYFIASDEYFNQYVYEAAIHKKYLSKDQLEMLKLEPVFTEPWEI